MAHFDGVGDRNMVGEGGWHVRYRSRGPEEFGLTIWTICIAVDYKIEWTAYKKGIVYKKKQYEVWDHEESHYHRTTGEWLEGEGFYYSKVTWTDWYQFCEIGASIEPG